jgi:hypothetical protein
MPNSQLGKGYSTGQVAKILELGSARQVAKLIDEGKIETVQHPIWTERSRRVPSRALVKPMAERGIPFSRLDPYDVEAQRAILRYRTDQLDSAISAAKKCGNIFPNVRLPYSISTLKKAISEAEGVGEIFAMLNQSSAIFFAVFDEGLGSLENATGGTRNNKWARVFEIMAEVIKQHTRVCLAVAKAKLNAKRRKKAK